MQYLEICLKEFWEFIILMSVAFEWTKNHVTRDLIRSIKSTLCPGWQRFISLISVSSVLVTSSSRHRCVWFYKIGHTWTYGTIHYKRNWRGTFRSLIKISIYFGIDHPPWSYYSRGLFFGGLSGLCILGDPGAVNQAGRKGPLKYFRRNFSPDPTNCNWVFEDEVIDWETHSSS